MAKDRPPRSGGRDGDSPRRPPSRSSSYGERPPRRNDEGGERPPRRFDRPEGGGDRPFRPRPEGGGDRPFRPRPEGGGDRPFRARPEGGDRPPRRFDRPEGGGDRPYRARPEGGGDRPYRARPEGGDRPPRRFDRPEGGERPRRPREGDDRRTANPYADSGPRVFADKTFPGERVAKIIARSGLASRREVEDWIDEGRISVNGRVIDSPALNVTRRDEIRIDGSLMPTPERTRLWLYHKARGLVTTESDPEGRPTVFEMLPKFLPRVMSVGRLDVNTEGLLLLTNDGGVKRVLELPATGWLRRYRVRAFGEVETSQLEALSEGITIEGTVYGPIEAAIERKQGDNVWLTMGIREGKNREIKAICEYLNLKVNRLIRVSFGPFQLGELDIEEVREIPMRILKDQLGERLINESNANFEGPVRDGIVAARDVRDERSEPAERPYRDRALTPTAEEGLRRPTRAKEEAPRSDIRATRKAKTFADVQDGVVDPDMPDVEIDEASGRMRLKPRVVEDPKGREVAVARKPGSRGRRSGREGVEGEAPQGTSQGGGYQPEAARFEGVPAEGGERGERPQRSFGYKGRAEGERPRSFGGKSQGGGKSFGSRDRNGPPGGGFRSRPPRDGDERPRPPRQDGDRPFRQRPEGGGDRPYRARPEGGGSGERTFRPRPEGGGGDRPYRARPEGGGGGERTFRQRPEGGGGERPHRPRPEGGGGGDRPFRPRGGPRKPRDDE
jgi:23S rRNA pseudouridine2605 synthase